MEDLGFASVFRVFRHTAFQKARDALDASKRLGPQLARTTMITSFTFHNCHFATSEQILMIVGALERNCPTKCEYGDLRRSEGAQNFPLTRYVIEGQK